MEALELVEITAELRGASQRLEKAGRELYRLAYEKASTEQKYRHGLHVAIMELKGQDERATLIPDMARGMTKDLKFERDLADHKFTAGREAVDAIKVQISALQTILRYQTEE